MSHHRISEKQERFAQAFVETGNASEAYRQAYDVRETTKPQTIWESASKLLKNPKVATRVAELRATHLSRHELTVNDLIIEYDENRFRALETGQIAAANAATTGKARLYGLPNKSANVPSEDGRRPKMGDAELARRLSTLIERAGCR